MTDEQKQMQEYVQAHLAGFERRMQMALTEHAERMGKILSGTLNEFAEKNNRGMLEAQSLAEDGPVRRLRQNVAAGVLVELVKAHTGPKFEMSPKDMAHRAVQFADALLAALEEKP